MEIKLYKTIREEEIKKELECVKKIILYECNEEYQHSCVYYEGKWCTRCIPLEKRIMKLKT